MTTKYAYKFLKPDNTVPHGSGAPALPKNGKPGKWTEKITDLRQCVSGYHLVETDNMAGVLEHRETNGWLVEYRGKSVPKNGTMIVVEQYRLIRQVMGQREWVLFAADCAEHVLTNFESASPDDDRPRRAIEAARTYALDPSDKNRKSAAWSARSAGAAAGSAAWSARSAGAAAAESAGAAAGSAAWSAAGSAAWSAEREWGYARLREYLEGTA